MFGVERWTFASLTGPLLPARDREHSLQYDHGRIGIPARELWG